MRNFNQWISEITDDLSSLEVATLTKLTGRTGSLKLVDEPKAKQLETLEEFKKKVEAAQTKLLALLGEPLNLTADENSEEFLDEKKKRVQIRAAKKVLREAERQLKETEKALGIYDPKDLFSKIRAALPDAHLVAYSRFELEGDSMNFINSNPAVQSLVNSHHHIVAASQEARKALFDIALKRDKKGGSA